MDVESIVNEVIGNSNLRFGYNDWTAIQALMVEVGEKVAVKAFEPEGHSKPDATVVVAMKNAGWSRSKITEVMEAAEEWDEDEPEDDEE